MEEEAQGGTCRSSPGLTAPPARSLARSAGPATSREAAEEIIESGEVLGLQARALVAVQTWPGSTARELSKRLGDGDPRTINRRLGEVEKTGRIRRGTTRRDETTGKNCATWWPVEEGTNES